MNRRRGPVLWIAVLLVPALWLALSSSPALARSPPAEGFADLVERLTPAVVNIASTIAGGAEQRERSGLDDIPKNAPGDEFFDFFGENGQEGAPEGEPDPFAAASLGSGFIIDAAGFVVTNNHVIADAEEISVVLDDGSRLKAEVVGRDAKTDLALLKVNAGHPLPFVRFGDSDAARVGDWIIAIGNPFGLGNSVSAGIVSARGRDINAGPYDDFLQTDAPINRGNSGGPMFDLDGAVIGVNTLIYSPSGGSVGIGFATPSAIAKPVIDQLKKYGGTRRGWIGVRIQSVSDDIAQKLGLAQATGALVAGVIEKGPAAEAGIKSGDVILRFDGRPITSRRTLPRLVADTEVGRNVEIVVWREGKETKLSIALGRLEDYEEKEEAAARTAPEKDAKARTKPGEADPPDMIAPHGRAQSFDALGVTLAELDGALRQRFGVSPTTKGVVVTEVDGGVTAESVLAPGDVILEVDRQSTGSLDDVRSALEARSGEQVSPLIVLRQRKEEREFVVVLLRAGEPGG